LHHIGNHINTSKITGFSPNLFISYKDYDLCFSGSHQPAVINVWI